MYEFVKKLLPPELLDLSDITTLRDLREFFDERVQEEKQKRDNANIEQYRPIYEGKFMLQYGKAWDGPVSVPNKDDIEIVKVNKLDFVGNGFIRADVDVLNIKYSTPRHELNTGLTASDYGEITIDTYHDNQYAIYINDDSVVSSFRKKKIPEPVFLTEEQVIEYMNEAKKYQLKQIKDFTKKVGIE